MKATILSIGTEITRGELTNTNASWLSASLTDIGFEVLEHVSVDDDRGRIIALLERLQQTPQVVVCTGGLGPTTDDLTTDAVATALGKKLVRDAGTIDHIRKRFEKFGRTMSESNAKQADFPEGADILPNPVGTAPGFGIDIGKAHCFFMPGVPVEMKKMFADEVVPRIGRFADNNLYQFRLATFGLPESVVGEKLAGIEIANPGVIIGYRAHFPEIEVKVLARTSSEATSRELCERVTTEVKRRLGDVVFSESGESFPAHVSRVLRQSGKKIAIAESCTGGLVGSLLTREPGASDFLLLDAVTYSNRAKTTILGVDEEMIRGHGAVSAEVAAAMAEGVRFATDADIGLAITGVAGPSGGTETKPVGLVYLALSSKTGATQVKERRFGGERHQIQTFAAYAGLKLLRDAAS